MTALYSKLVFPEVSSRNIRTSCHMLSGSLKHAQGHLSGPASGALSPITHPVPKQSVCIRRPEQQGRRKRTFNQGLVFASKGFGTPQKPKKLNGSVPVWEIDWKQCPCRSGSTYEGCCRPFHDGKKLPPTPEALMRSRFSAFVKKNADFLVDTTHPDNPKARGSVMPDGKHSSTLREDCLATMRTIAWQQLSIVGTEDGSNADEGYVTFIASFKVLNQKGQRQKGNVLQRLRERSRFAREEATWLYVDGEVVVTADAK